MANYLGYSSINANKPRTTNANVGNNGGFGTLVKPINAGKKYKLVDTAIVVQDLINALNIPQGQKVGQPQYGTTLWSYVFEPNDGTTQDRIKNEVRRVISLDPRLIINYVACFPKDNGVLIEVELAVTPFNQAQVLQLFANINTYQLTLQ